jgi:hypothetical protein
MKIIQNAEHFADKYFRKTSGNEQEAHDRHGKSFPVQILSDGSQGVHLIRQREKFFNWNPPKPSTSQHTCISGPDI